MKLNYNVESIPRMEKKSGKNLSLLREFCASGRPVATVEDGQRSANRIRQCLDVTIKRENLPCVCVVRNGVLYLVRKDVPHV